jgi:hypothetical protein
MLNAYESRVPLAFAQGDVMSGQPPVTLPDNTPSHVSDIASYIHQLREHRDKACHIDYHGPLLFDAAEMWMWKGREGLVSDDAWAEFDKLRAAQATVEAADGSTFVTWRSVLCPAEGGQFWADRAKVEIERYAPSLLNTIVAE